MQISSNIISNQDVFFHKRPPRINEAFFEKQILSNLPIILSNWHILQFKKNVYSEILNQTSRPDLVLIHKEYKNWCVVEVETTNHGLINHVIPQISVFQDGNYNDNHVEYLLSVDPSIKFDKLLLRRLILDIQPQVFVISEHYLDLWHKKINEIGCNYFAFEPYENHHSRWSFYYKGDIPNIKKELISHCNSSRHYSFLRCLQLTNKNAFTYRNGHIIQIMLKGELSNWKIFKTNETVIIIPITNININLNKYNWSLFFDDGVFILEKRK